jgi:hypothetical protein
MLHPSTNHLVSRVRDFIRWQQKMFGDPSARGAPLEDPPGWATDKEFWIRNTVWRATIFEGNNDDATAAADALIDHGLLRVKLTSEGRERTTNVRVREQIFRAFAVSRAILSWEARSPARPDQILAAPTPSDRDSIALLPSDAPDLAPSDYLAANLRKALARQAELLDLPVDPADPRVGRLIADVVNQTLNAALRAQENSLALKRDDDEYDRMMEARLEERRQAALLAIEKLG